MLHDSNCEAMAFTDFKNTNDFFGTPKCSASSYTSELVLKNGDP